MKIAVVGYGIMGKLLAEEIKRRPDLTLVGVVAIEEGCFHSFEDLPAKPDMIIDFSSPVMLDEIFEFVRKEKVKVVFGTTGFTEEDITRIEFLSTKTAILQAYNFSLGVAVLNKLVDIVTPILNDSFDIEIIEKHHNKKVDSPSGTANLLLNTINAHLNYKTVYGRSGNTKRDKEIGVHSIRGGTITGEHSVIYAGLDEVIELKHEAHSKMIFVNGALTAARFLNEKEIGLYHMKDVLL
ncbi:MAG: 4-hydroxy-tetrahydrodipicolinate reductase [Bacilli bacterium]|nr:4-hydroxy-tetrahydrodipicolinate reductase [Bacilli bacterium]